MASVQAVMSEDRLGKVQNAPNIVPEGWSETQDDLAASTGLAVVLVDGQEESVLKTSNNNSICQAFLSSKKHSHHCETYCGTAHNRVKESGEVEHFRCHAGLHCFVTSISQTNQLSIIGGRAFVSRNDYKELIERLMAGDLRNLFSNDVLQNIIFSNEEKIDALLANINKQASSTFVLIEKRKQKVVDFPKAKKEIADETKASEHFEETNLKTTVVEKIETASTEPRQQVETQPVPELKDVHEPETSPELKTKTEEQRKAENKLENSTEQIKESEAERNQSDPVKEQTQTTHVLADTVKESETDRGFFSLESFYFTENAKRNFIHLLKPLLDKHHFTSISLLVRQGNGFVPSYLTGRFRHNPVQIQIDPWDERLTQAVKGETSIALKPIQERKNEVENIVNGNVIELFPMIYRDDVLGVLLIGQPLRHAAQRREVSAFCREAALQLEIVRLNAELERRAWIFGALQRLAERVNTLAPEETYRSVLTHSSELLGSERASLLLFDEGANELEVKAAFGPRAQEATTTRLKIGEGVAGQVFQIGHPIIANDITVAGYTPAPAERRYKSNSFISFPLIIGGKKLGVLNLTDKIGGGTYNERDLKLIENIAPHLALAIGRAEWQEKATEFELMSITDPLTGLLNRRYLEERMDEEVKRCQRHNFQMSFLMIDIDDFKNYNDYNGHPEGDKALEITARCLKSVLRADDVAARYGGEEFSILLPQTSLEEAEVIAERIRIKIEDEVYPNGKKQPLGKVTVSIGVAGYSTTLNTPDAIIGAADRAMYLAKRQSKNRVQVLDYLHKVPFFNAPENTN